MTIRMRRMVCRTTHKMCYLQLVEQLTLALSFINSSNVPSPTTAALRDALADDSGVVVDLAAEAPAEEARRPEEPASARGVLKTKALSRSSAVLAAALEGTMAPPVCLSSGASWPAVSGDGDGDDCMVTEQCAIEIDWHGHRHVIMNV